MRIPALPELERVKYISFTEDQKEALDKGRAPQVEEAVFLTYILYSGLELRGLEYYIPQDQTDISIILFLTITIFYLDNLTGRDLDYWNSRERI